MKILYISTMCSNKKCKELFELSKGKFYYSIQKFHNNIVYGLTENGMDVTSLSGLQISSKNCSKRFFKCSSEYEDNIKYVYPIILNFPILKQLSTILFFIIYTIFWCIKNKDEDTSILIDSSFVSVTPFIVFLAKIFSVKITGIVADIYDYMSFDIEKDKKRSFIKKISCYLNLFCWKNYDSYILLTEAMNSIVNKKRKPYIILEGIVKDNNYSIDEIQKKKAILYAGTLDKRYGIKKLVDAFQKLELEDYELWICGVGELEEYLKNIDNEKIKFLGSLTNHEVLELEKECILLVNPRPTSGEYTKYSFPSKNLEYMLSGTPLLTTALSGMPKEYYNYVYIIEDETVNGIASKIKEILSSGTEKMKNFGKAACNFIINNKNTNVQGKCIVELLLNNKKRKNNKMLTISIIGLTLMFLSIFINNISFSKNILIIYYLILLVLSFIHYKIYAPFIIFLISFFVFTMGQYFFNNVTNDFMYYKNFESNYAIVTMFIQYVALFCTFYGFQIYGYINKNQRIILPKINYKKESLMIFKYLVIILCFFSSISFFVLNLEKALFVFKNGYLSLYNGSFISKFPQIMLFLSNYYYLFFSLLLAVQKKNKIFSILFYIFIVNSFINLLTGTRFDFMYSIILIIFYFLVQYIDNKFKIKKNIKIIIMIFIVTIPFLLMGLNIYNNSRNKINNEMSIFDNFTAFFVSQGRSVNLITYSQMYEKELKKETPHYIFGLYNQSLKNRITKLSFGLIKFEDTISTRKMNFAKDISILVLGESLVKQGHGLGSQYLAELYIQYGYIGIILYSLFVGFVLNLLYLNRNNFFFYKFLLFYIIFSTLHIPRALSFEFISPFLSVSIWCLFIFIILLNKYPISSFIKRKEDQL